ncbi:hypothetical protein ABID19_006696 [Mesorhizobium robiniae]|uniref:Uncharacterized protein n=1 Tax=Mesorhizobium robiniae TaxID=559315 RepID=A0ABV2GZC3_9HYPH
MQLSSSDESSGEDGSPDALSGKRGGGAWRDMGASMRTPPRFTPSDSYFSGSRHSVDIPQAHLGGTSQVPPQSSLRPDPFSSARYTSSPVAQPEVQTKKGKNRGLWSRIKSGVGKAFSGSHRDKAFGAPVQQEVVSTSVRVYHAKQPSRIRGVFDADEALLEEFRSRATGRMSDGTIRNAQADVRNFSAWLSRNGRAPIAGRLGNPQLEPGLERDLEAYATDCKSGTRRTKAALNKLRDVQAGNVLSTSSHRLAPYSADATLIDMWAAAEKPTGRVEPDTVDRQARRLSRLSDWLQGHGRGAMAGRLFTHGLAQDVEEYKQQAEDTKIKPDLLRLQRYQQVLDANQMLGLTPARQPASSQELPPMPASPSEGAWTLLREHMQEPASWSPAPHRGPQPSSSQERPATPSIGTPSEGAWNWFRGHMQEPASWSPAPHRGPQPSSSQERPATPSTGAPSEGAWNWFREYMLEPATPSSAAGASSDFYGDFEPLVNLSPPTPYGLHDYVPGHTRQPSFVGPPTPPQEVPDIGPVVGEGWRHGSQSASAILIDVLENVNLLPNQFGPRRVDINGERYSVTLGPAGRSDVRLIHHPRARQGDEAASSSRQINEAGPSSQGVADLGYLIRGGWQHRERLLPNYLARALEGEHLMPEPGRPTYFNIRGVPYRGEFVETDGGPRVRIYPEVG